MDEKFVGFCIAVQNFRIFSLNLQPFKRSPERQFLRKISFVLAQFMSLPSLDTAPKDILLQLELS